MIAVVLRRRGVTLTDDELERVLACREESTLTRWCELAWVVGEAAQLWRSGD